MNWVTSPPEKVYPCGKMLTNEIKAITKKPNETKINFLFVIHHLYKKNCTIDHNFGECHSTLYSLCPNRIFLQKILH